VLAALGAGGMGEVYRARDTRLGREVAVKILPSELTHDPERCERFEREAHIVAARLHNDPETVRVVVPVPVSRARNRLQECARQKIS
jgi:serine/threonine protein kinase